MNTIAISIIMPVYNAEAYLSQAIDSILAQTFKDFELIIINDGSRDKSKEIIMGYSDNRIVYLENEQNKGLIFSLNKCIAAAKGLFIARMDADDICLPDRLEIQKNFLEQHDAISVVASPVIFIDSTGKKNGNWELDLKTIMPSQIKKTMPYENCIAHPSVMFRTAVLKEFQYKDYQKNIEDYDLWLRLLNRGHSIGKTEKQLLLYRIHDTSITGTKLKTKNFFFKHLSMKRKFAWHELKAGKINTFTFKVIFSCLIDLIKGIGKSVKRIFKS